MTLEDPNSANNCSEQVFLLFLSSAELSKDELTQSILAVLLLNGMITLRHWASHLFNCIMRFIKDIETVGCGVVGYITA